jgi:flagellar hook-associated protein 1 FlgK
MSASALMNLGVRAMAANYAALQTTGNNISNANTKGYSRQQVELATAGGQYSGGGFIGKGVDIQTVTRAHDDFLTKEAATTNAMASADSTRSTQLQALEKTFQTGEAGLGYAAGQFLNAFVDVASSPQDLSARQVVLARANDLSAQFQSASQQIDGLQAGVNADLKANVVSINALAAKIASLNDQISGLRGTGHSPNDLLDQRDQAINDLSGFVQVTTIPADDSSVSVFIGGGQRLVLGSEASKLGTVVDSYDPNIMHIGIVDGPTTRELPSSLLAGGSVAGLLKFQDTDLVDARNLLGQLATGIAGAINGQQALGRDLATPSAAGSPIFFAGTPQTLPASGNAGSAAISLTLSDTTQVKASDYKLTYDGANYQLTRQASSDAPITITPAQLAAGFTTQGLTIKINSGTPAAGDSFLLRPVATAAGSLKTVMSDPKGIAAAAPVVATVGLGNSGTMGVASLDVKAPIASPAPNVLVKFNSAPGGYTYSFSTDGGTTYGAAQPLVSGQPIAYQSTPGTTDWQLSITGTPANGDTIKVDPASFSAPNNGNANSLLALRDAGIVGGVSVTDAYADALTTIGVRVQSAASAASMSSSMASDAETARASQAGVNLDEEAAHLMQYQQSYQAAAKMLQVAQAVFDTLLQTAAS